MLTLSQAQNRAEALVAQARKAGADAADAFYVCNASTGVSVRLGKLEDVEQSEGEELGLRVFVGSRSATISASDLSGDSLSQLVDRAVAMAREAPEDPYAGLAPESLLLRGKAPVLDLADKREVSPEELRERALAVEDAARDVPGVTNSEGGGASTGIAQVALVTSHGFVGGYSGTSHGTWASVLAGEGAAMQRDHASHSVRHLENLEHAEDIGRRAGHRAVSRLNPIKIDSGSAIRSVRSRVRRLPGGRASSSTSWVSKFSTAPSALSTIPCVNVACVRARSTVKACRPRRQTSSTRASLVDGYSTALRPGNSASSQPAMPAVAPAVRRVYPPPMSIWRPAVLPPQT